MKSTESLHVDDDFDSLIYRRTSRSSIGLHEKEDTGVPSNSQSASIQRSFSALPPKLNVKLFIHEEVTSMQEKKHALDDISCHVTIEGTVHAQVISSGGTKNPPFAFRISDPDYPEDNYQFNPNVVTYFGSGEFNTLNLPKAVLGQVKVASHRRSVTKKFMPILVQSKVVRTGPHLETCILAIQIRSNLKNKGSLKGLVVTCAVPPTVNSKTLNITHGQGAFDDLKRVIRWNVKELPVGNSTFFGAEVEVCLGNILIDEMPKFPVLLRCHSSADTVSSVEVDLKQIEGSPATITAQTNSSFRLLHRLPS